jgi:putative transposase
MLVQKAYKFRIYPTTEQEHLFRRTIGCCRLVYNLCLDQKKLERERSNPRGLSAFDQAKELTALKREFEFLREVPHHPLMQSILDLHKAFKNFFEGRAGFPKFRRNGENDAFRYPDAKQIKIEADRIFLPKAGWTRMVMHRPIQGKVKNATVSEIAGDWHVSIQVEHEVTEALVNRGTAVGIDLGGVQPIVLSDGRAGAGPGGSDGRSGRKFNAISRLVQGSSPGPGGAPDAVVSAGRGPPPIP